MKQFEVKEVKDSSAINIVVVGVGGGGSNMLSHLAKTHPTANIKYIAMNTDLQALNAITDERITKMQIGRRTTKGLG